MLAHIGKRIVGLMVLMLVLVGCAQKPLNLKPLDSTKQPSELIQNLGQELEAAKKDRVHLLAPKWFASARASHLKASDGLNKGVALEKILEYISNGEAELSQALEFAEKSKKSLDDVIKSRDAAYKAGADKRYKKAFAKLENDFIRLNKAIENNEDGYVRRKRKSLNSQYRDLELKSIKDAVMVDVRRLMKTAESLDMEDAAPKSYGIAKRKHVEADAVITKDRYNKKAIEDAVGQAEFFGRRLHHIAAASNKVDDMEPEGIVLWMESFLAKANTQLKQRDNRNLSFKEQHEAIMGTITLLQRNKSSVLDQIQAKNLEIEKLNKRLTSLEGHSSEVRADKERLAAEKQFNDLYIKVQRYFSPTQAEVYKRSQHLVIRLKAIKFPVGQSVIVPGNYPLLNKVQRAIKTFGSPNVVIEGHTDSTGSAVKNKALSLKRAESVRQYLIHNGVLEADKIEAKGYGSARPLASNATRKGRAVNRRIDVVIKPERGK